LQSLPIPLKDATCPDVGRIAGKIRQYGNKGYVVLIYGDRTHPESQGLLGYAPKGFIVENSEDVAQFPSLKNEPICILSQSTMSVENFHEVCQATRRKYPQLLILDTICPATKLRQNSIKYLLERGAESIVVVGDRHSSNTQQLYRLASQFRPTFWVQNVETLTSVFVPDNQNIVGVTAGASTPQDVVNEVCRALSQH
jgi:4-hydroxy-3-methylbut-2-enyl diphosphate reductase